MTRDDIHTCHADCDRPVCVAVREAVKAEREACAKIVEESNLPDVYSEPCLLIIAAAIRAREGT